MSTAKLGRKKEHRERTLRNLATSLVLYEKVQTTEAKAKAVLPMVERLISFTLKGDVNARRQVKSVLFDTGAVAKLFEDLPARQGTRESGFVRLTKIGPRPGDNAPMVQMEILLTPLEEVMQKETKTTVSVRKSAAKKEEQTTPKPEASI